MQQAIDFLDESTALSTLLASLSEGDFETPTQFKGWTINNIIRHLHVWNIAVDLSLHDEAAFGAFVTAMMAGVRGGKLPAFEESYLDGLSGHALRNAWIERAEATAVAFADGALLGKTAAPSRPVPCRNCAYLRHLARFGNMASPPKAA